ncbi:uncharacterized protein AAEQ78_016215 [Lycaon pictus]
MVTAKPAAAGRGSCSQPRERRTKPGAWATPGLEPGGLSRGTGTQENPELEAPDSCSREPPPDTRAPPAPPAPAPGSRLLAPCASPPLPRRQEAPLRGRPPGSAGKSEERASWEQLEEDKGMGEYPPTLPTSWGDLASQSLDPPSSPRQLRLFLSAELFLQR